MEGGGKTCSCPFCPLYSLNWTELSIERVFTKLLLNVSSVAWPDYYEKKGRLNFLKKNVFFSGLRWTIWLLLEKQTHKLHMHGVSHAAITLLTWYHKTLSNNLLETCHYWNIIIFFHRILDKILKKPPENFTSKYYIYIQNIFHAISFDFFRTTIMELPRLRLPLPPHHVQSYHPYPRLPHQHPHSLSRPPGSPHHPPRPTKLTGI